MEENNGTYKLYYFNGNGRAMIIRAILEYSKAKWEDIKVSNEEWPKMKSSSQCEYGQLPVLEYNGKTYSQSHAIELYLGKKFNLYGSSIDDEYQINSLLDSFDDLFIVFHAYAAPTNEEDKKNKEEATKLKEKLENLKLEFKVKTGANDKVFGSISPKQIKESIDEKGFKIDKKQIEMDETISSLGVHNVKINLYGPIFAKVKIHVVK